MRALLIAFIATSLTGCYVPMPSVGVRPTKVQHYKKCMHNPDGTVTCVHEQRWIK